VTAAIQNNLNLIRLIYTAESRYSGFHTVETSKFWFAHSVDGATENERSSTQVVYVSM